MRLKRWVLVTLLWIFVIGNITTYITLNSEISNYEESTSMFAYSVDSKSTKITRLEDAIQRKDNAIKEKNKVIERRNKEVSDLNEKLSVDGETIQKLESEIATLTEEISLLETEIAELERNFKELQERRDALVSTQLESTQESEPEIEPEPIEVVEDTDSTVATLTVESSAYVAFCDTGCIGITASGYDVSNTIYYNGMRIIATDTSVIPMYSIVKLEGFSETFIALDTGGAIKGHKIDILVDSTNSAFSYGRQSINVEVIEWGN